MDVIGKLIEARLVSLAILVAIGVLLWRKIIPAIVDHYKAQQALIDEQAKTLKHANELSTQTLNLQLESSQKERRDELNMFRQALTERDQLHRMELSKRDELNAQLLTELARTSKALDKISNRLETWPRSATQ